MDLMMCNALNASVVVVDAYTQMNTQAVCVLSVPEACSSKQRGGHASAASHATLAAVAGSPAASDLLPGLAEALLQVARGSETAVGAVVGAAAAVDAKVASASLVSAFTRVGSIIIIIIIIIYTHTSSIGQPVGYKSEHHSFMGKWKPTADNMNANLPQPQPSPELPCDGSVMMLLLCKVAVMMTVMMTHVLRATRCSVMLCWRPGWPPRPPHMTRKPTQTPAV
jgi:hypothetical protein